MKFCDIIFDEKFKAAGNEVKLLGKGHYSYAWLVPYSVTPGEPPIPVVLKVLDLTVKSKSGGNPESAFIDEIKFLNKLRHPSLVRVLGHGGCKVGGKNTLYYMSDYDKGVTLDKFFKLNRELFNTGFNVICSFATSILDVLAYCHSQEILHLDMKPDNILVRYDNEKALINCTLIDFGKAKYIYHSTEEELANEYTTVAPVVPKYVHPDLLEFIRRNKTLKKYYAEGAQKYDLYSVAVILEDLLMDESLARRSLLIDEHRFLQYLIEKLKNLNEIARFSAVDGLSVLERQQEISNGSHTINIRLNSMTSVNMGVEFLRIIELQEFQRLRHVNQLGLSHLVYPSATHTRFSHCLGVFGLASKYANHLSTNYYFRFRYSEKQVRLLKLKALLHDIGHYPFAHYLEELDNHLSSEMIIHHETYTKKIIKGDLVSGKSEKRKSPVSDAIYDIIGMSGAEFLQVFEEDSLLSSIIDGPIDCDKLDYLLRDGFSAGVPYAESIDCDRFLSSLTCTRVNTKYPAIGISPKGVTAVETILMARYQLFSEVYWHKSCRAIAAMIKHAMWLVLKNKLITQSDYDYAVMNYGDFNFLKWLAIALSKQFGSAATTLITDALIGKRRNIYKRILTYSAIWADRGKQSPYKCLVEKCNNYSQVCDVKNKVVETLNGAGNSKVGWIVIEEHDLLLDIPPVDKDIQEGIEVVYSDDSLGKGEYKLEEVSPILRTMTTGYLQSTKKFRIFINPILRAQVYDLKEFKSIIAEAIIHA